MPLELCKVNLHKHELWLWRNSGNRKFATATSYRILFAEKNGGNDLTILLEAMMAPGALRTA